MNQKGGAERVIAAIHETFPEAPIFTTIVNWQTLRPDHYIAVSSVVKARIKRVYGKKAGIIFPPMDVQKYRPIERPDDFYQIVSRLNSIKRIGLAVEAFNLLGLPLKIIGAGPFYRSLKYMAKANVTFLGRLPDPEVAEYYAACKALIFPGEEDFGITLLEANAAAPPVITFKRGGALDTVREGLNGLFFGRSTGQFLMEAVKPFENGKYYFDAHKVKGARFAF